MPNDGFTCILDKRDGVNLRGFEEGGVILRGKPVYRGGSTGLADSIKEVLDKGLIHVPTYRLVAGRAFVGEEGENWLQYYDSNAERITAIDQSGIIGAKGAVYVLDIQNGGLFVWNPQRIREAVEGETLVNHALKLEQSEIDAVLDAMKRNDAEGLRQIVHGRNVAFAGNYDGFLEASASPDFVQGMDTTYLVIRQADEARNLYSEFRDISAQRENPDLVIASGGRAPLAMMLDKAKGFGWRQFGAWHDSYKSENTGRVVGLADIDYGVDGNRFLDSDSCQVGVAPEALGAFYEGNVPSLEAKVLEQ